MADISPLSNGSASRAVPGARHRVEDATGRPSETRHRESDRVELSDRASRLGSGSRLEQQAFRPDLVARVRDEIEAGSYESETKLALVADKLSRSLDVTA